MGVMSRSKLSVWWQSPISGVPLGFRVLGAGGKSWFRKASLLMQVQSQERTGYVQVAVVGCSLTGRRREGQNDSRAVDGGSPD